MACNPPAHARSAQIGMAIEADQKGGDAGPLRCNCKAPAGREIERSRIAPELADDGREGGASYPLLHRPQGIARIARLDVDEIPGGKAGRMNSPAFKDCHSILDP